MLLQFRLGRIPVQVHYSHLLIAGLFGWMFSQGTFSPNTWPGSALANGAPENTLRGAVVVCWVGIIFLSVLIHELGHATVSLAFGYEPAISLVGMGGNTQYRAKTTVVWWRDVLVTLAGPGYGLALGVACWLVLKAFHPGGPLGYVLDAAFQANAFWTVMNLLPVTPLDGGRISSAILMRLFGRPGFLVAQILALAIAGAAVLYGVLNSWQMVALLFAWYGFAAIQRISAYLRGDAPAPVQNDPVAPALVQAASLFQQGKLEEAQRAAEGALEKNPTPPIRSRLHHLLGWISLKEGQGRPALDHFAQVQGTSVEPAALAAGFSLVGDDERALTLWEHAYKESGDRTVLHEWAGALIRLWRLDDVKRLKDVDMATAYGCAERVLFIRGEYDAAARTGLAALEVAPSAERAYDTACAFARAGKLDDAVRLLERAASLGFRDAAHAETDEDLAALRGHPGFSAWLAPLRAGS